MIQAVKTLWQAFVAGFRDGLKGETPDKPRAVVRYHTSTGATLH
jgi:hypothetical protein